MSAHCHAEVEQATAAKENHQLIRLRSIFNIPV